MYLAYLQIEIQILKKKDMKNLSIHGSKVKQQKAKSPREVFTLINRDSDKITPYSTQQEIQTIFANSTKRIFERAR